jgi:transcriptional regulator with XRE-family HTH domain
MWIFFTAMTAKTRQWPDGYDPAVDFVKLGRIFRESRESREWSRARVSTLSGVPTSTIQQVENGGNPELRTLVRLSEALGLSLATVISEATTPGVTPLVSPTVHNADSSYGGVDAPTVRESASAADIRLLQRVAIAILHLVGAPELPPKD